MHRRQDISREPERDDFQRAAHVQTTQPVAHINARRRCRVFAKVRLHPLVLGSLPSSEVTIRPKKVRLGNLQLPSVPDIVEAHW
jgi:hypothetical protein